MCLELMCLSTLLINIILTIYLVIGTVLEEKKLIYEWGDHYRDYIDRVSMLFPAKWIFSKLSIVNKSDSSDS